MIAQGEPLSRAAGPLLAGMRRQADADGILTASFRRLGELAGFSNEGNIRKAVRELIDLGLVVKLGSAEERSSRWGVK